MSTKLTDLAALGTTPAAGDFLTVVDIDDTSGGAAGTSKKVTYSDLGIGAGILTQVETSISNAQVLAMKYDNTPITLVNNIAGQIIVPVSFTIVATWKTPSESSSDNLNFGWDAGTSTTVSSFVGVRDFMNGVASGVRSQSISPFANGWGTSYPASPVNKRLQVWCTDVFNGGWDMVIYTTYYTITV